MLPRGQGGSGGTGPKRGPGGSSSTRSRGSRGGFHPFARPDKAARGAARGAPANARGGRGAAQPATSRGAFGTTRGNTGGVNGNRLDPSASAAGSNNRNATKSLRGERKSKSASPFAAVPGDNADQSAAPKRQKRGGAPKAAPAQDYNSRYEQLKQDRAKERTHAIQSGLMADPNQPTSLHSAITPTGTCTAMCPEFERVERTVQKMVDKSEKAFDPESGTYQNVEAKMLKRFRRSAAGYDEQLPSDIRTPKTLLQTMNYILRHVLNDEDELGVVHKFVWDRTRSIRNDLSIQQLTQTADVEVAVKCLERIARFHIISLHLLSSPDNTEHFDHHQEREQLNNTLLSLMYYYDDNCGRINFPNEDEFRAYYIVFSIHDQRPDLEARVQTWPRELRMSPRIQAALKLFAAAGNTWEYQGALDAKRPNAVAQGFYSRFFNIVRSENVSYLMSCVAEIYFNQVRQTAIRSIWKAYCRHPVSQQHKNQEWTVEELTKVLAFDHGDQTIAFCEEQDLQLATNEEGQTYLNWADRPVDSVDFQPSSQQTYSEKVVESKRRGRSLPALILGMNVSQALRHGMIDDLHFATQSDSVKSEREEGLFVSDDEEQDSVAAQSGSTTSNFQANFSSNPFVSKPVENSEQQAGNGFAESQSKSQLSGAAPTFTPQSSVGSTATQNPMSSTTPSQPTPSMNFGTGTNPFAQLQTSKPFSQPPASFSSSFTSTAQPSFSSPFTSGFKAPGGLQTTQQATFSQAPSASSPFTSATSSIQKPDSTNPFAQAQKPSPFNPFASAQSPDTNKPPPSQGATEGKAAEPPKSGSFLFPPSSSSSFGQRNMFGQATSGPANKSAFPNQSPTLHSDRKSPSTSPPATISTLFPPAQPPAGNLFKSPAPKASTSNMFGAPFSMPGSGGERFNKQDEDKTAAEQKQAQQEREERENREREKQDAERIEAERQEAERKEAERREAQRREEEEKRDAARREAERREAEKREAEQRAEEDRKEAEQKAAAEQEAAKRERERRDKEMAERQAREIKAARKDIERYRAAKKREQDREMAMKRAIEEEITKRKATDEADEEQASSKRKAKAPRISSQMMSSNEAPLTVEELLDDFEESTKAQSPAPKAPAAPSKPAIDKDEILLSSARLVAHTMAQGSLFDRHTAPYFRASLSSSAASQHAASSRSRSVSSVPEGDRAIVNGYEVALAPERTGLGQSMSRTEQRIRATGAAGFANKPFTHLLRSSSTEEASKQKSKKSKKEKKPSGGS